MYCMSDLLSPLTVEKMLDVGVLTLYNRILSYADSPLSEGEEKGWAFVNENMYEPLAPWKGKNLEIKVKAKTTKQTSWECISYNLRQ